MFQQLFLVLLCGYISYAEEDLANYGIVGGHVAPQQYFNYQVSLLYYGRHFCGGTLYAKNIVISAAHCTLGKDASVINVRAGSDGRLSGGQVVRVESITNHPGFTMENLNQDVSILKLASDLRLGSNVGTIPLTSTEPAPNTWARVSGWGYTSENGSPSNTLLYADVIMFDRSQCRRQIATNPPYTKEMICGGREEGGVDSCQGDSGGPLVADGKLIGVVSWGIGCARSGQPGVYSNVAVLRPWIERTVRQLSGNTRYNWQSSRRWSTI